MAETIAIIKRVLDTVRSNGNIDMISVKNDYGARFIEAVIAVDGKPIHVDQGAFVTIEAKRADMQSDAFSGAVNENGTVKVPITQWMLEIPNTSVEATVVVHSAKTKLSTTNFYIKVQNAPHGSEEISPDDPNYDILIQVLAGESGRVAAENARQSNEEVRQNSENYRNQNEEARVGGENARMINEDERIANERARVAKDSERDEKIAEALADSETAKADSAAALAKATTAANQANAAAAGSASAKSDAALAVEQSNSTRASLVNLTAQVAGIGRTYVVPTFLDFIDFLKSDYSIVLKEDRDGDGKDETYYIQISSLKSGDNIIITEKGVPDFWFERNAALTEFESYTYEGTEYSLGAILSGLVVGGAHVLETDYSVIEGHAISAAASANQALLAAGDAAVSAGEADVSAKDALRYYTESKAAASRAEKAAEETENVVEEKGGSLFSNTLKGKKSGGAVSMSDISPLEHTLDVRVRGAIKVKKFGKNLLNNDTSFLGEVTFMGSSMLGTRIGYEVRLPEGKYTISAKHINDNSTLVSSTYIYSYVNDKNGAYKAYSEVYKNVDGTNKLDYYVLAAGSPHKPFVVTIKEGDVLYIVDANIQLDLAASVAKFNNVQIQMEEGAVNTEYEPYIEPVEYAVNEDGTVDGVTSIYPTTTLLTDTAGAVIDVEYNRDINKAFAELYNAIISLGGNV